MVQKSFQYEKKNIVKTQFEIGPFCLLHAGPFTSNDKKCLYSKIRKIKMFVSMNKICLPFAFYIKALKMFQTMEKYRRFIVRKNDR